ncbi:hypothetical protein BK816_04385 [Boudabousia tangfeifanii]|uniref:Primosomal protein N' 3' DNA-binding domain-containing protein n=1 Tax=Boudabousia tangfeifanii TaxID=1912795 RepID=A0A1D9MKB9_9ACTO|nr:hypothetical protein [Boudabousia tangfeifanii]AOZ72629.1 hypothetical protein BK816_04385 [Boudabousia tangfeifanii]
MPEQLLVQVLPDSTVPALDRLFTYLVPSDIWADIRLGMKVKIPLGHSSQSGWVIAKQGTDNTWDYLSGESFEVSALVEQNLAGEEASLFSAVSFKEIQGIITPLALLTPQIWRLVNRLRAYCLMPRARILHQALPIRQQRIEKAFLTTHKQRPAFSAMPLADGMTGGSQNAFTFYQGADEFFQQLVVKSDHLDEKSRQSGHMNQPPSGQFPLVGWWESLPSTLEDGTHFELDILALQRMFQPVWQAGKAVLVIASNHAQIIALGECLRKLYPQIRIDFYSSKLSDGANYEVFLRAVSGHSQLIISTRKGVYLPVKNLGLVIVWQADSPHFLPARNPRVETSRVAWWRSLAEQTPLLLLSRTLPLWALAFLERGEILHLAPTREAKRQRLARVEFPSDWQIEQAGMSSFSRLPSFISNFIQTQSLLGPLLVQVPRRGDIPVIACQSCFRKFICEQCGANIAAKNGALVCPVCTHEVATFSCPACASTRWRALVVGIERTVEQFSSAFPRVPVLQLDTQNADLVVGAEPKIVVATSGTFRRAEGGYVGAVVLDPEVSLAALRADAQYDTITRWAQVAALVKAGGRVLFPHPLAPELSQPLIRQDYLALARHEWRARSEVQLPPTAWMLAIIGAEADLQLFAAVLSRFLPNELAEVYGPLAMHEAATRFVQKTHAILSPNFILVKASWETFPQVSQALWLSREQFSEEGGKGISFRTDPFELL